MLLKTKWWTFLWLVLVVSCQPSGLPKHPDSDLAGYGNQPFLCQNPLPPSRGAVSFNLASCAGKYSYIETARLRGGLKDLIDLDGQRRIVVINKESMRSAVPMFAPKVNNRALSLFRKNPQQQFDRLMDSLQGKEVSPLQLTGLIGQTLDQGNYDLTDSIGQAAVRLAPFVAIASQGGSYVWLNQDSYFVNVGYKDGRNPQKDIRSGRSFASAKGRPGLLDASDVDYLKGLTAILNNPQNIRPYFRAILKLLTASDPSGFDGLDPESQTVAADFAAVFTAELNRHIMMGFKPLAHPWEQDLMEATFISAFVTHGKHLFVKGRFVEGNPTMFFAQGCSGGGLGNTFVDRRRLSGQISRYLWSQPDKRVVSRLARAVYASPNDDIFQSLASLLIHERHSNYVLDHAEEITEAASELFYKIYEDSATITRALTPPMKPVQ